MLLLINKQHPASGPESQTQVGRIITHIIWMSKYLILPWNAPNIQSFPPEHFNVQRYVIDLKKDDICRDLKEWKIS